VSVYPPVDAEDLRHVGTQLFPDLADRKVKAGDAASCAASSRVRFKDHNSKRGMDVKRTAVWLLVSFMAPIGGCGSRSFSAEPDSGDAGDAALSADVTPIFDMAPDGGADGGEVGSDASACAPTASSAPTLCSNNTPQFCGSNAQWEDVASGPCSGSVPFCLEGACVECAPSTSAAHCSSDTALQTCQASGTWNASPCPTLCKDGACLSATKIFVKSFNTCALLSDSGLACWGDNSFGQLANGSFTGPSTCEDTSSCATAPVRVAGLTGVTSVAIGFKFACAALSDGTVKCWGRGIYGILGSGTSMPPDICYSGLPCAMAPATVAGLSGVTAIAAGDNHACALLGDGDVWCWGANDSGQLGYGSASGPDTCSANGRTLDCAKAPVAVKGLHGAVAIAAGREHTCALLGDGTVSCWGDSSEGALGDGTCSGPDACSDTTDCATSAVKVSGLTGATAITAFNYATCALLTDKSVLCWGTSVENGASGDASTCRTDTLAAPSPISGATEVAAIAPYCVLTMSAAVDCWGYNNVGQLGNGTVADSTSPVTVSGLSGSVDEVASSGDTVCAILSTGAVSCWGFNGYGMLGMGDAGSPSDCGAGRACATTPVPVLW
jgi:alpha-tubulin suppressor-like RCC1 family protein